MIVGHCKHIDVCRIAQIIQIVYVSINWKAYPCLNTGSAVAINFSGMQCKMMRASRNRLKKKRNKGHKDNRTRKPGASLARYISGFREKDAQEVFEAAFKVYSETASSEAVGLALQAAWKMPEAKVAAERFSRIAKLTPNNAAIQNDFGALLCRSGQYEAAETAFRQSLLVDPNDGQVLYNIGQALMGQEKYSKAEVFFRKTIIEIFFY